MADPGSVERNVLVNEVALQRAAQRNGGQNIPVQPPSSVTGADIVPSRAVSTPHPYVGTIDESPGGMPAHRTHKSSGGESATMPSGCGAAPNVSGNRNQSWNMSDIANYKIGG